jgi:hypothetical protein
LASAAIPEIRAMPFIARTKDNSSPVAAADEPVAASWRRSPR